MSTYSLAWAPDGMTHLLSGHFRYIREWDTSTWKQIGDWTGHTSYVFAIAINSTGTLVASASYDSDVRLWRCSDRQTILQVKHSNSVSCVAFSTDGKHIFSAGFDNKISQWHGAISNALLQNASKEQAPKVFQSYPRKCCRINLHKTQQRRQQSG
jgi:WD40 repeat protein